MPQKFDSEDLKRAIGNLRLMKFSPLADPDAASAMMEQLAAMCPGKEALEWLISKAMMLYSEWPSPLELRALLCAKFKPADGVEAYSGVFLDGFPLEFPVVTMQLALPPGYTASADSALEGMVADLARRKALPSGEVVWERCAICQGTGRKQADSLYCVCALGRDLERAESKVRVSV